LGRISNIESLDLASTPTSDGGLAYVARLPALKHLTLYDTEVEGNGLQQLARLTALETLTLSNIRLDDIARLALANLRLLKELRLYGCVGLTREGLDEFRKTLPGCDVISYPFVHGRLDAGRDSP
jgi:hypothetical protein